MFIVDAHFASVLAKVCATMSCVQCAPVCCIQCNGWGVFSVLAKVQVLPCAVSGLMALFLCDFVAGFAVCFNVL